MSSRRKAVGAASSKSKRRKRSGESANSLESPEAQIAVRVSRLRKTRRMTLDGLSEITGLSKGYLSKIENGHQVPPIGTLARIAGALGTDVAYFLQDSAAHETEQISVVRASEREPAIRGGSQFGYDYKSLAHRRRFKQMEPFVFRFPKELNSDVQFAHEGEEFLFVLSGKIEFQIGEKNNVRSWILDVGDSIYFDSSLPHKGRSLSDDATALVVVLNPGAAEPA